MKSTILTVLVMCLMVMTCEILDQREDETQGNHLSDQQIQKFENSLFNIFDRLGSNLNRNKTATEDGSGNNLNIIKNLSFHVSMSSDSNCNNYEKEAAANYTDLTTNIASNISVLLERITKMEASLKSMEITISVLTSNVSALVKDNDTKKLPESIPKELAINPCKTASISGVFTIEQMNQNVYCEMTTFGGGWIVFQQKISYLDKRASKFAQIIFHRNWTDYRAGFGTAGKDTEFWLGLEALHQITNGGDYELAVDMEDLEGNNKYARYSKFRVSGENDQYRLTVGGYSGTAGDSFSSLNNMKFTTFDRDNDNENQLQMPNCAFYWGCGWWFDHCQDQSYAVPNFQSIHWPPFIDQQYDRSSKIRMMIRHK